MIGYRFPTSGAVCLAMAPSRVPGEHIVLMHWNNGEGEWVVGHLATHHFPAPEEWYWGHYFSEHRLAEAVDAFVEMSAIAPGETRVVMKSVEVARRRTDAVIPQAVGL
jgi:hypothetical protein